MNISIIPLDPSSLKFTAHGYMKITSTSNRTNRMATRKYLMEKGCLALPTTLIPASKVDNLSSVFLAGPSKWVAINVVTTKPSATTTWNIIGRKSEGILCVSIILIWYKIKRKRQDNNPAFSIIVIYTDYFFLIGAFGLAAAGGAVRYFNPFCAFAF